MIAVGELYNRNVNGRNSTGIRKQNINPAKISYVKDSTYKVFSYLLTNTKSSWSDCVKIIDKSNEYLFNVIDKKFDRLDDGLTWIFSAVHYGLKTNH